MKSQIAHDIKHRQYANDEFMTPGLLARYLVGLTPFAEYETILDPCPGQGAFVDAIRLSFGKVKTATSFFEWNTPVDWIVGNPPYSKLDDWFEHSFELAQRGVAYLLGVTNITPRRIEMANKAGFGLTCIHLCKVFHWYGISAFCVFEKGKPNIIAYDRIVWR